MNAYDRMKDALIKRIDDQIKLTRDQGEEVNPLSSGSETTDKVAMQTMYRNAMIKGMRLAAGFVVEEYKRLSDPKPKASAEDQPQRHAPYGANRSRTGEKRDNA